MFYAYSAFFWAKVKHMYSSNYVSQGTSIFPGCSHGICNKNKNIDQCTFYTTVMPKLTPKDYYEGQCLFIIVCINTGD